MDLARADRRPLVAFHLASPPVPPCELLDFRTASEGAAMAPSLRFALRQARRRRPIAVSLDNALGTPATRFPLTANPEEDRGPRAAR